MRDKINLGRANFLHPTIRQQVIDTITHIEETTFPKTAKIRLMQGLLTIDEKNALFVTGRTASGTVVTNAKGGQSYHNYGLAFDFVIMYDKDNNGNFEALSWDLDFDYDKDGKKISRKKNYFSYTWDGDWVGKLNGNPHLEKNLETIGVSY